MPNKCWAQTCFKQNSSEKKFFFRISVRLTTIVTVNRSCVCASVWLSVCCTGDAKMIFNDQSFQIQLPISHVAAK